MPRQGAIQIALEALGIDEPIEKITISQTRATVLLENGDYASSWITDDRRNMEVVHLETDGTNWYRVGNSDCAVTVSRARYDQWATVERLYGDMQDEMRAALGPSAIPPTEEQA